MPVKMIALKRTVYADRALRAGDAFESSAKDAMVLEAIGAAKRDDAVPDHVDPGAPAEEPRRGKKYRNRELTAGGETDERPPRRYRRRDMIAEGGDA